MEYREITISPPLRIVNVIKHKDPNFHIYFDDMIQIRSILDYNRFEHYIIYPEFDSKGRLHYHGRINLNSNEKIRFYKHAMAKLAQIGYFHTSVIKHDIKSQLHWDLYMKKEWPITKEILGIDNPIMPIRQSVKAKEDNLNARIKLILAEEDKSDELSRYFIKN